MSTGQSQAMQKSMAPARGRLFFHGILIATILGLVLWAITPLGAMAGTRPGGNKN